MKKVAHLIVNFGGPRHLDEIEDFLIALLTDQDVLRTPFPSFLHRLLFERIAKKRARQIRPDYLKIGGKSPIYEDTESIAETAREILEQPVYTFHRYIPQTHPAFIESSLDFLHFDEVRLFPLFPQFSYATTGSIARWFSRHLNTEILNKMRWVKSYPNHPAYVRAFQILIREFLEENQLKEEETVLLFSAHGLPQQFISTGDLYQSECELSFRSISEAFPKALSRLSYQSKFGKGEWLRPYTNEVCEDVQNWANGYKQIVIVPLSFTSDHIETLFEIEELYLPPIREKGFEAFRCPALNRKVEWIAAVTEIMQQEEGVGNQMLCFKS